MGWTYTQKYHNENTFDFFSREFNGDSGKVIACFSKLTEAYIAYELKDKTVIALVCLLHRKDGLTGYKDMDETMGPNCYNAPESLLNMLSPTDNPYALDWRHRCKEKIEKSKKLKQLKKDVYVKFVKPINFTNGDMEDTFKVISLKPLRFKAIGQWACIYKITKDRLINHEWNLIQV